MRVRPRWFQAAAAAFALGCLCSTSAAERLLRAPGQQALMERAASALARGDAAEALRDYELAAAREHAVDIELGIVRSLMRTGEYRRALAFAAHSAGAHGDDVQGALMYARLLDLGGQTQAAQRVHEQAAQRARDAAALDAARQAVAADEAASFAPLREGSRVGAAATLVNGGRHALVATAALGGASTLELRDGLGRSTRARVIERDERWALALLELAVPFEGAPLLPLPPREAFAGAPAHAATLACAPQGAECAVWPRLQLGFLGGFDAAGSERALGIDLGAAPLGGPVFDTAGRWLGIALPGAGGARLASSRLLAQRFGWSADAAASGPVGSDVLYETALRVTLQVIVPAD